MMGVSAMGTQVAMSMVEPDWMLRVLLTRRA